MLEDWLAGRFPDRDRNILGHFPDRTFAMCDYEIGHSIFKLSSDAGCGEFSFKSIEVIFYNVTFLKVGLMMGGITLLEGTEEDKLLVSRYQVNFSNQRLILLKSESIDYLICCDGVTVEELEC